MLQFASTVKSRISPDLEKGNFSVALLTNMFSFRFQFQLLLSGHLVSCQCLCPSEEEEEDEEEESDDETGDLVLQSSSLSAVDEEKEPMEPPAKQPRTSLNLHTLTESHSTPP